MKDVFFVFDATYQQSGQQTLNILLAKKSDGSKVVLVDESIQPYFYVHFNDLQKTLQELKKCPEFSGHSIENKLLNGKEVELLKVYARKPSDLQRLRDAIKHKPIINECYEHTLNQYKRFLRDKCISPASWVEAEVTLSDLKIQELSSYPTYKLVEIQQSKIGSFPDFKILAFDIEYVDGQIVLISFAVSEEKAFVYAASYAEGSDKQFEDEKELLMGFVEFLKEYDPDFIVGYNSDGFDLDIIREKIRNYRLKLPFLKGGSTLKWVRRGRGYAARIEGAVHIDLFPFVQNILAPQLQSEVLTLNEVASEIVGEGKEEIGYEKIIMLWREGPREELVAYSRNDAILTYKLARSLLPQILSLSNISGETPFDATRETYGLLVDNYLVKKTRDFNAVALNLPKQDEILERRKVEPYAGGYVIEPKPGLHENLAVFDFRSLYPSIIVSFNISPETLNCDCCKDSTMKHKVPEKEFWFCAERKGFISSCVEEVLKRRFELKEKLKNLKENEEGFSYTKEMQGALKVLANASYGYLAYSGARWYCRQCAESCAAFGRHFIKLAVSEAENFGEVIYGDTDSLFLKVDSKEKAIAFLNEINSSLPGIMELELQGVYRKGIFSFTREKKAAKKRYALVDSSNRLLVRGFEAVRKDWCELAKKLQMSVLRKVLDGKIDEALSEVRDVVSKVKSRKVSLKDLSMVAQLGKELDEYKQKTPHAVAARKLIDRGYDISKGEQIRYIIVEGSGSIADRAEPLEFVDVSNYDVDYYLNHQIYPAALRVLEVLGFNKNLLDYQKSGSEDMPTLF
ncbi:MAG: DNA-directed DNA polymerase [Actinobacteria bacterium]|nr:DNA-directed DNA polymerase [Actinomycetota bacterium]